MNITLIGMAGAGKSTIGKELSRRLRYQLFDIDDMISQKNGKEVPQIILEQGEEVWLEMECAEILSLGNIQDAIIAPGGSIIYVPSAMEYLQNVSKIVLLEIPFEIVKERIDASPRGIIGLRNKTIQEIFDERQPLYREYADITIPYKEGQGPEKKANEILMKLELN